jgi:broad specificity phosphatase PhoE
MAEHSLRVLDHDVHGGEALDAVAERCWAALSEVLAVTEGPLIAVSHGIAIHALVERRFGHDLSLAQIGNGDVFELWIEGDAVTEPPTRHPLG